MIRIYTVLNDEDFSGRLSEELENLKLSYEITKISVEEISSVNTADVLLIDERSVPSLEWVQRIKDEGRFSKIIVITMTLNSLSVRQFMVRGIMIHFVNSPMYSLITKIRSDEETAFVKHVENSVVDDSTKFIAISSPSGGSGKTTLSLLLASAYAGKKKRVLVIDMTPYSDMAAKLKIKHENNLYHVFSTIMQGSNTEDKILDDLRQNVYHYMDKVAAFDLLYGLDAISAENIDAKAMGRMGQILKIAGYDIVIFDTPSTINESVLALFEFMHFIVLVSSSDIGSGWKLIQEKELLSVLQTTAAFGIVVNKFSSKGNFSCKQLERELQYPLFGVIPFYPDMSNLTNSGKFMSLAEDVYFSKFIKFIGYKMQPVFNGDEIKLRKIKH
ncbi:MAG: ParA family protein [Acetatifactor sp.]|nr:ParA family protein [Acetatifactor sp.]